VPNKKKGNHSVLKLKNNELDMHNFLDYYNLEQYLLETVRPRFHKNHSLNAFDFFCIIIWKANRAKSNIAKRVLRKGNNLNTVVKKLTKQIYITKTYKGKLNVVMVGWGFRLPMASAILTVLYPDDFTVYDTRVCDVLQKHHKLGSLVDFDSIWLGYQEFIFDVKNEEPKGLSLRDKDRFLWGKSFAEQLQKDVTKNFNIALN
jgi:hypothetical protein